MIESYQNTEWDRGNQWADSGPLSIRFKLRSNWRCRPGLMNFVSSSCLWPHPCPPIGRDGTRAHNSWGCHLDKYIILFQMEVASFSGIMHPATLQQWCRNWTQPWVFTWPPLSPALNTVKHLCDLLDKEIWPSVSVLVSRFLQHWGFFLGQLFFQQSHQVSLDQWKMYKYFMVYKTKWKYSVVEFESANFKPIENGRHLETFIPHPHPFPPLSTEKSFVVVLKMWLDEGVRSSSLHIHKYTHTHKLPHLFLSPSNQI